MPATAEQLAAFLEALRDERSGFETSDQQFLAAHELIGTLAESGRWPATPEAWKTRLAPVLCSSELQQEQFYQLFQTQFGAVLEKKKEELQQRELAVQRRRGWRWAAGAAVLLVLGVGGWYELSRSPRAPVAAYRDGINPYVPPSLPAPSAAFRTRIYVQAPNGRAVPGAKIYYLGQKVTTGPDGSVILDWNGEPTSRYFLVAHPGYRPAVGHAGDELVKLGPARALSAASSWRDDTDPLTMSRLDEQRHLARFLYVRHFGEIRWTLTLLPLLLLTAWLTRLFVRALEIRRWTAPLAPRPRKLGLNRAAGLLFSGADIRKLALALRCRKAEASDELAPEPTVEATLRQGGIFTPVHANRQREPEYLILAERKNTRDHQTALQDELLGRLRDHDVWIDRYYFQSDPRVCIDTAGQTFSLGDLAALYPAHQLWLACEAERCLDPFTGQPEKWFRSLSLWRDRVLLSYQTPPVDLEMTVSAPTRQALQKLATQTAATNGARPYPSLLRDLPERWLDRVSPEPAALARLLAQLRRYLSPEAFVCLQACAVYPALAWNLTKTLAAQLVPPADVECALEQLSRLPWFRHGTMPDWLRRELVSGLGERRQSVLEAIRRYLDSSSEKPGKGELEITPSSRPGARRAEGRLTDQVYLSFLWDRKVDRLSLEAPQSWHRMLYRSLRVRIAAASILAAVLSVVGFVGAGQLNASLMDKLARERKAAPEMANWFVGRMLEVADALQSSSDIMAITEIASDVLNRTNPLPPGSAADLSTRLRNVRGIRIVPGSEALPGMVADHLFGVELVTAPAHFGNPTTIFDFSAVPLISRGAIKETPPAESGPNQPPQIAWCYQEEKPAGVYGVHCHATQANCEQAKTASKTATACGLVNNLPATGWKPRHPGLLGSWYELNRPAPYGPPFPQFAVLRTALPACTSEADFQSTIARIAADDDTARRTMAAGNPRTAYMNDLVQAAADCAKFPGGRSS